MMNISERRTFNFYIFNKGGDNHGYQKIIGQYKNRTWSRFRYFKKKNEKGWLNLEMERANSKI